MSYNKVEWAKDKLRIANGIKNKNYKLAGLVALCINKTTEDVTIKNYTNGILFVLDVLEITDKN